MTLRRQERLLEFQWALVDAADRLLFGEVPSNPVTAQLATHDAQIASVTNVALRLEDRIGRLAMTVLGDDESQY
jgi:hypothetical protein